MTFFPVKYAHDSRIVLTLDAGGTNMVFTAIQGNRIMRSPVTVPTPALNLERCLQTIIQGFEMVADQIGKMDAISFAFPGPADYPNGIIGDCPNLPCFRGGVALGPLLEHRFHVPVIINNDGDLFTYGEAKAGFLPKINALLKKEGREKQYHHLLGITLGTGLGAGLFSNGDLHQGDNSLAAELWMIPHPGKEALFIEESVSIRGIRRTYADLTGQPYNQVPDPKVIYEIAKQGLKEDSNVAKACFRQMGQRIGYLLRCANLLIDGLIVIGGGLSGSGEFFMPALIQEMNRPMQDLEGRILKPPLLAFDLEDELSCQRFLEGNYQTMRVIGTDLSIKVNTLKATGVGLSVLGTSQAIATGAYIYALHKLDRCPS
jgi:glucokinase